MGAQTAVSREHTVLASPLGELTLVRDALERENTARTA